MSVDTILKTALSACVSEVEHSVYTGESKTYIVFNYATVPNGHADDEPEYEKYLIQVHLIAPLDGNINPTKKQIKLALKAAGFIYPETIDASNDAGRHIVFETEYVDEVEEDNDV